MTHTLRLRIAATVFELCFLAASPVTAQREVGRTLPHRAPERVAILPFVNISGAPGDDWIGAGIAETLAVEFQKRSAFVVIPGDQVSETLWIVNEIGQRLGARWVRDRSAPSRAGTGRIDIDARLAELVPVVDIGRRLGARWVISGGYQRLGDQLQITGRLVDVTTRSIILAARVDGAIDDLFTLQDRLAAALVTGTGMDSRLAARRPALSSPASPPLAEAGTVTGGGVAINSCGWRVRARTGCRSGGRTGTGHRPQPGCWRFRPWQSAGSAVQGERRRVRRARGDRWPAAPDATRGHQPRRRGTGHHPSDTADRRHSARWAT